MGQVSGSQGHGMAGIISKLKSGVTNNSPPPLETNPIMQYFEVGKECTTAGPGLVWRVHDAYRKSDGKHISSRGLFEDRIVLPQIIKMDGLKPY